jgi:hypothetical protein
LKVFGFGNTATADRVLLNNLMIYRGTPTNGLVSGIPEPTGCALLALFATAGGILRRPGRRR